MREVSNVANHEEEPGHKDLEDQLSGVELLLKQNLDKLVAEHLSIVDLIQEVVEVSQVVSQPINFQDPHSDARSPVLLLFHEHFLGIEEMLGHHLVFALAIDLTQSAHKHAL